MSSGTFQVYRFGDVKPMNLFILGLKSDRDNLSRLRERVQKLVKTEDKKVKLFWMGKYYVGSFSIFCHGLVHQRSFQSLRNHAHRVRRPRKHDLACF